MAKAKVLEVRCTKHKPYAAISGVIVKTVRLNHRMPVTGGRLWLEKRGIGFGAVESGLGRNSHSQRRATESQDLDAVVDGEG